MNLLPRPRSLQLGEGIALAREPAVLTDAALPAQGYRLAIDRQGVTLAAADEAGAFYGQATYAQLLRLHGERVPVVTIEDWPDLPVRGVMLDVSRDKVPTMATLKALVSRLASWKLNHLQLYTEHTFAYSGHEVVWRDADPFTTEEILELDAWCRQHHVELAANQNCLGHMERWLRHEVYRPLAISPDGWVDRRGRQRPPTTIDPGKPGALDLVLDLLGQLVPLFASPRVNVGLDEPWELPPERHDDYVAHIAAVRAASVLDGREMLMWGDIVAQDPGMERRLPDGVTICEWGYEASHPFDERAATLAAAGRPFWVCPGTSSWNTLVGRTTNMVENCRSAASSAVAHGAEGYLVTDWGDNGHLQYLPVSEPGFAWAAAMSWCGASNSETELAAALGAHVFDDPTGRLGAALLALGDAHRGVEPQLPNMSILALPLYSPSVRMGEGWTEGITDTDLENVEAVITDAMQDVAASRSRRRDAGLVRDELMASAELLLLLCRDARARLAAGGSLEDVPERVRRRLSEETSALASRHIELWRARNRNGGLVDSARRLWRLELAYLGEELPPLRST